jgi:hypothetical protein
MCLCEMTDVPNVYYFKNILLSRAETPDFKCVSTRADAAQVMAKSAKAHDELERCRHKSNWSTTLKSLNTADGVSYRAFRDHVTLRPVNRQRHGLTNRRGSAHRQWTRTPTKYGGNRHPILARHHSALFSWKANFVQLHMHKKQNYAQDKKKAVKTLQLI